MFALRSLLQKEFGLPSDCLSTLPRELLGEILKELEWRDVLAIRKTSRGLCEASKSRVVWQHLLRRYNQGAKVSLRLEKPLELYSQAPLESVLLRGVGADIGWGKHASTPARRRTIQQSEVHELHLIEGGRWLLTTTKTGMVRYYDLDTPDISDGRTLIPASAMDLPYGHVLLSLVDLIGELPNLAFRLAIIHHAPFDPRGPTASTSVWLVSLVCEGNSSRLMAEQLAALPNHNAPGVMASMSLGGAYLARSMLVNDPHLSYIEVFEWKLLEEHNCERRMIYTSEVAVECYILKDRRVVSFSSKGLIHIFQLDDVQVSTSTVMQLGDYRSLVTPFLAKLLSPMSSLPVGRVSKPHYTSEGVIFSFYGRGQIRFLVIPTTPGLSPRIVNIGRYKGSGSFALGLTRVFGRIYDYTADLISLPSLEMAPTDPPSQNLKLAVVDFCGPFEESVVPAFDEGSGQVAMLALGINDYIIVSDYSRYYTP